MSEISVKFLLYINKDLETLASKLHRSKSWLVNQALREFIERREFDQIR